MTTDNEYISIYNAGSLLEANVVKGLLIGEGIDVQLQGEHLIGAIGELPPTDVAIGVMIHSYRHADGKVIVDQYLENQKAAQNSTNDWYCHGCGETNSAQFEICWNCQRDPNDQ
jgi:hypothetical protein